MSRNMHIWLGKFESKKEFSDFFEEDYSEEDSPISDFAACMGTDFYDNDWLECHYVEHDSDKDIVSLVPNPYGAIASSRIEQKNINDPNAIILFHREWSGSKEPVLDHPPIWYLGQFNNEVLQQERTPAVETGAVAAQWWRSFPSTKIELAALEKQQRKGSIPSAIKLALMYSGGIYVKQDRKLSATYLRIAAPYPELLHECLLANGVNQNGDAWLSLFYLCDPRNDKNFSNTEQIAFLENAVSAGSLGAQYELVALLMYPWKGKKYNLEPDHKKAERMLLQLNKSDGAGEHQLFCLYNMKGEESYNPEKAFYWLDKNANKGGGAGPFGYLAEFYKAGVVVETNDATMCKYIYLSMCQQSNRKIDYYVESLDACDRTSITEGRLLAKEWISSLEPIPISWLGELCDPFEQYLADRKDIS